MRYVLALIGILVVGAVISSIAVDSMKTRDPSTPLTSYRAGYDPPTREELNRTAAGRASITLKHISYPVWLLLVKPLLPPDMAKQTKAAGTFEDEFSGYNIVKRALPVLPALILSIGLLIQTRLVVGACMAVAVAFLACAGFRYLDNKPQQQWMPAILAGLAALGLYALLWTYLPGPKAKAERSKQIR
jgi:hypothetical protein